MTYEVLRRMKMGKRDKVFGGFFAAFVALSAALFLLSPIASVAGQTAGRYLEPFSGQPDQPSLVFYGTFESVNNPNPGSFYAAAVAGWPTFSSHNFIAVVPDKSGHAAWFNIKSSDGTYLGGYYSRVGIIEFSSKTGVAKFKNSFGTETFSLDKGYDCFIPIVNYNVGISSTHPEDLTSLVASGKVFSVEKGGALPSTEGDYIFVASVIPGPGNGWATGVTGYFQYIGSR